MSDRSFSCYHDSPHAIETYSGGRFDVTAPKAEDVRPIDLAHALSNIGRYGGHGRRFYSVGAHSIFCHDEAARRGLPDGVCLLCLLHDGHESYNNDLGRPIKSALEMQGYLEMCDKIQACVHERFAGQIGRDSLRSPYVGEIVKEIDNSVLAFEVPRLMRSKGRDWKDLGKITPARITKFAWLWYNIRWNAKRGFLRRLRKYGVRIE